MSDSWRIPKVAKKWFLQALKSMASCKGSSSGGGYQKINTWELHTIYVLQPSIDGLQSSIAV